MVVIISAHFDELFRRGKFAVDPSETQQHKLLLRDLASTSPYAQLDHPLNNPNMATTRSGVLEDRRVTRSMATPKPTLSGVVKRMVTAAPKAARKTAQKPKKTVLRKQNVTNPEPTSEDRATIGTDREMNTTTINNDTEIRAVTRSMTKKGDQTITVKSSVSKKTSVNATRGKGASTKNRGKATTSHEGSAPHAARPTTRSMTNNGESNVTIAPPEPPTQAERTLTASSHRITRQMANQNAPTTSSITNSAPVDEVQTRPRPAVTRTTEPPRACCANARTMITPRVRIVRSPVTAPITAGQERYRIIRTRASLRRALEGDQEWPDLTHGQRREMIRLFVWMRSEPGRTHDDYFNLPIRHEALTTWPTVDMSVIPRVRAWYEGLKTGTNDEEE
ncbi:hypothetical protein KCU77_g119, partial [Aureobasidium melanogenum]